MNANSICKAVEVLNEISFSKFLKQVDGKNWRLHFKIMAASGHKTMAVFKRYNMVDEAELKTVVNPMDTYMDTKDKIQEEARSGVNG